MISTVLKSCLGLNLKRYYFKELSSPNRNLTVSSVGRALVCGCRFSDGPVFESWPVLMQLSFRAAFDQITVFSKLSIKLRKCSAFNASLQTTKLIGSSFLYSMHCHFVTHTTYRTCFVFVKYDRTISYAQNLACAAILRVRMMQKHTQQHYTDDYTDDTFPSPCKVVPFHTTDERMYRQQPHRAPISLLFLI